MGCDAKMKEKRGEGALTTWSSYSGPRRQKSCFGRHASRAQGRKHRGKQRGVYRRRVGVAALSLWGYILFEVESEDMPPFGPARPLSLSLFCCSATMRGMNVVLLVPAVLLMLAAAQVEF